jgi:hypothetical protein
VFVVGGAAAQARDIEMGGDGPVIYSVATPPANSHRPATAASHARRVKSHRALTPVVER